jgi:hypothetical protein
MLYRSIMASLIDFQPETSTQATLRTIKGAHSASATWLKVHENTSPILKSLIKELSEAQSDADMINKIGLVFDESIEGILCDALWNQEIDRQEFDKNMPVKLLFKFSETDRGGCFLFNTPRRVFSFGRNLNSQPFARETIEPMVEIICRLDREKIISVLKELQPIAEQQIAVNAVIKDETRLILESNATWSAQFSVNNMGPIPFILFPDGCEIIIKDPDITGEIKLDCRIVTHDDKDGIKEILGVALVKPNASAQFEALSKEIESKLTRGAVLRSAYQSGKATGIMKARVRGPQIPRTMRVKSTRLDFKGGEYA